MPIPTSATVNEPASNRLKGRASLISGGGQGIGFSIASRFQQEGSCVFLLDCDVRNGKAAAELTV
jgi:NAD(P)-dependent dehydrogenase (short-subunit alcohol dehydrogenase family)